MIPAECHSDDGVVTAAFDATPWFEQASELEIFRLAECGWGGDYPADEVAYFMSLRSDDVARMFKYVEILSHLENAPGFECRIERESALEWLRVNRAAIHAKWLARIHELR
jgi:hypothetical protein